MTLSSRRIIIFLIIAALITIGIAYLIKENPVPVILQSVEKGNVEFTVTNTRAGTVKACRRARLAPTIGGQIAHLNTQEGAQVKTGQVLLELWNDDLRAQVKLAQSEAMASRATSEQVCLVADEAEREAKRQRSLLKKELTSEGIADKAITNANAQKASCEASKATAKVSESRIDVARAALERTMLKAPFDGTVAEINGELAEFVTPSPVGIATPPAVDLIDNSCLFISAPIDEVDAPLIKPGMDARITLDAFSKQHFTGLVQRIAPYVFELEKQARTIDIEAVFMNPEDFKQMLPGYSADVEVILDIHKNVMRIPTETIQEGNKVFVYQKSSGILEERIIESGLSNWKYTEILSGLDMDDLIVLSIDREGVIDGASVEIEKTLSGNSPQP